MRQKTNWLLTISFILLAFSACQPQIQLDEENQPIQQPENKSIETITQSPIVNTISPSLTPHPTEEPIMSSEPTALPTSAPTDLPAAEPSAPSSSLQFFPPAVQNWIDQAVADLAQRQGISTTEIELLSYESREWSDASLGCPQPDMKYAQVPQDGYLITLVAGDLSYNYHGSDSRGPFLCQQIPQTIKKPPPLTLKVTPTISVPPPRD
jgi:hypothetical protein